MNIIPATSAHLDLMITMDPYAQNHSDRRDELVAAIQNGAAWVGIIGEQVVSYITFSYHFFGQGFINLVMTAPSKTRQGYARQIVKYVITICKTQKIFTSTNKSNTGAQRFFTALGFHGCGEITGLDDNDPELFFMLDKTKAVA